MIRLRLFGSVDLKRSDDSELRSILAQAKPLGVLAYLASATPVGYHRREELLSIFWPELDSARGRRALSQSLHVLRGELEEGALKTRGAEDISLDPAVVSSDVGDFRSAIARQDWGTAAELYRGELLSGFLITGSPEFDQWLEKERARLRAQAIDAAWHLSSDAESSDNKPVSHRWARRAIELDQYNEDHIRRLMSLLDRSGNRSEAINVYEEFRARVTRDLELEPSQETRALAESLRETVQVPRAPKRDTTDAPPLSVPQVASDVVAQTPRSSNRRLAITAVSLTVVIVLAAFMYVRNSKAESKAPTTSPMSQVVIAEFQSAPADTALGRTVTEALRLDLSRSHLIKVVSDATIRDALGLMRRDTMLRMTPELAREIAIRESAKGFLTGEIRRTGAGFALSARLVSADNGELISGWRANASDSTKLLAAIDQLSASVRHDAGESMKAISESSPLLRVSTTSLPALRKHAMGTRAFYAEDYGRAAQLFEEAVAEDSTFSDAYMMLSTVLGVSSTRHSRAIEAAIKAYQYRDKLRDAERYNVISHYLWVVKGDVPGTIAASNNAAALDPSIVFWGRISSLLTQQRKYREGELAAL
ncbi:MAG: BTAD domain-containing putative transcriptional regulator, partial [Gemmatimonadales bacterium]